MPFIIGGDFQVEPKQLEDSGWVRHRHAVVSRHRFLPRLSRPCRRVRSNHADLKTRCTAPTSQDRCSPGCGFQPRKLVMITPMPWPSLRPGGCKCPERDLDWDAVRLSGRGSSGSARRSPSSTRWRGNSSGTLLMAPGDAEAFCGRSLRQRLGWKACKIPWCDTFPRGNAGSAQKSQCLQTHSCGCDVHTLRTHFELKTSAVHASRKMRCSVRESDVAMQHHTGIDGQRKNLTLT